MVQRLHLPGGVEIREPSAEEQIAQVMQQQIQVTGQILMLVDILLQLQTRIANGWQPKDALTAITKELTAKGVTITVPEPPNREERRSKRPTRGPQ